MAERYRKIGAVVYTVEPNRKCNGVQQRRMDRSLVSEITIVELQLAADGGIRGGHRRIVYNWLRYELLF